jgi:hypothetical protein
MDFICLYEIEQRKKPLTVALSGAGRELRGRDYGVL